MANVSGDRGSMGDLDRRSSSRKVIGFTMIFLAVGFFAWQFLSNQKKNAKPEAATSSRIGTPEIKGLDLDPIPEPATPPPPEPEVITLGELIQQQPVVDNSVLERKLGGFNKNSRTGGSTVGGTPFTVDTGTQEAAEEAPKAKPYDGQGVAKVVASRIPNRSLVITQGAKIPCTLETALDSSVPGMTSCIVSQDIYSSDGLVRLIDRGSKLNGRYESEMNIGQIRIGIVWNRLETPEGVIVDLGSDSIDTLGRAGASGWVDKRFWERFGHAIMFSLVSDGFQYINNRRSAGNNPNYLEDTEKSTQDMAQLALETEIDLKPILRKNQGEPIMIFLNKDLSFEEVYELSLGRQKEHPFMEEYRAYQRK